MAKVELKNLTKKYGDVVAVQNMNLTIPHNEFLVLVGPSGCGKSTTLRMIAGLEEISGGDIYIGDEKVNEKDPKDRNVSMVFQNYALYPHMTVEENLGFSLKIAKVNQDEIEVKVKEAVKILGLEDLRKRKPSQLSGGQRQRVAMGRAIVRRPDAFLFDEPLSNLDAKLRIDMRTEIKRLHQRLGSTIIYVTHDQIEAMTLATKIAVLKDGCIQQFDTPYEIYNNPNNMFVANFMGAPAMNLIEGKVSKLKKNYEFQMKNNKGDTISLPVHGVNGLKNYENKTVICGIRPESINDLDLGSKAESEVREVIIDVVEPAGSDTFAVVELGQKQIIARLNGNSRVAAGDAVELTFDLSRAVFFDSKSEERIR